MHRNPPKELAASVTDEHRRMEAKHAALRHIMDAWEEAVYEGLDPDAIATAAIFAALSDMIGSYGEEPVAVMCERLPERIRHGEFTTVKTRQ
ncbi:MAG TPA: hypothetical protein PKE19_06705 [Aestuariivirga sp.]|jgi:predicted YcjX-like family ATPase|nr:hypothetical protein [Aestuariivirga sp.]